MILSFYWKLFDFCLNSMQRHNLWLWFHRFLSYFFALHMRAVPLNVSSMCWRWRRQACRCSFICHFVLIYCGDYDWPPRAAVSMSGMLWCGDQAERDRRIRRTGPSRWNVLSVSFGSFWLRSVRGSRGPWMGVFWDVQGICLWKKLWISGQFRIIWIGYRGPLEGRFFAEGESRRSRALLRGLELFE